LDCFFIFKWDLILSFSLDKTAGNGWFCKEKSDLEIALDDGAGDPIYVDKRFLSDFIFCAFLIHVYIRHCSFQKAEFC
jgi:hypothetical protein